MRSLVDLFPSKVVVIKSVGADDPAKGLCLYVTEYVAS